MTRVTKISFWLESQTLNQELEFRLKASNQNTRFKCGTDIKFQEGQSAFDTNRRGRKMREASPTLNYRYGTYR